MNNVMDKVSKHIDWLRRVVFSDPEKRFVLETGEQLLGPNEINHRLFFVLKGTLVGFIEDAYGNRFEIFKSGESKIVGAYSFFSDGHKSYASVIAQEETIVAYIEAKDFYLDIIKFCCFWF